MTSLAATPEVLSLNLMTSERPDRSSVGTVSETSDKIKQDKKSNQTGKWLKQYRECDYRALGDAEFAGPENGGPKKKNKDWKKQGWKMTNWCTSKLTLFESKQRVELKRAGVKSRLVATCQI